LRYRRLPLRRCALLRDLGVRDGREDEAMARIEEIRARHEKKPTFLARLRRAVPPRAARLGERSG
jgi:hypothetical protein